MTNPIKLISIILDNRRTISALASRQVQSRYSGTLFRGVWEIFHPAITILVFWFIFSVVFKAVGPNGVPFIFYFVAGILPWMFFAEGINSGSQGVIAHTFLVKKMVFRSEILPFVFLTAGAITHLILLLLVFIVLLLNGITMTWHWLQLLYFFITLCAFMLGLQWLLSAITVFHRDLGQGVSIVLNLWFWATPIVWVADSVIPMKYQWIVFVNPLYYIIEGYRNALIYQGPPWINWQAGLYVWILAIILAYTGLTIFRRLKPHFGDVL